MTSVIDTLHKAVRHKMLVRVRCSCGNQRDFAAIDLLMRFGGGRDPRNLVFRCRKCRPTIKVELIEPDWRKEIGTIANRISEGYAIHANCNGDANPRCNHSAMLDLDALGRRLGYDFPAKHDPLASKLRCTHCGSRKVSLTLSPPRPHTKLL